VRCGFRNIRFGASGSCSFDGAVLWSVEDQTQVQIHSPISLLQHLSPYLPVAVNQDSLVRLGHEIENHIQNDALCIAYRKSWGNDLASLVSQAGHDFFLTWLQAATHIENKTLLLEQWGTIGHPWHPNYKTKLGLKPYEVIEMSPEFRANISIAMAALRADRAVLAGLSSVAAYHDWFARQYPQVWHDWQTALLDVGEKLSHWVPLPLHPFQLMNTVPQLFSEQLKQGVLRLLPGVSIQASPTMSFRSVVPEDSIRAPHMKLPVTLRLTSVQRTVSPKSAVMGTRFTQLFQSIAGQGDFDPNLLFVQEQVGLFYQDVAPDDEQSRHLAVLYRQNPLQCVPEDSLLIPVGSLFAETPITGNPLMTELVALYARQHTHAFLAEAALEFFRIYAGIVVNATLHAYLTLGIAFEAHQQNSFILLDEHFLPSKLLIRDFGDVRVYAPQLQAAGYTLEAYRDGHSLFNDIDTVRDKFLHAIMLCHVGEFAVALSRCYQLEEAVYWQALRQIVQETFNRCQSKLPIEHWQREHDAILQQPWPAKAFLRMRMSDSQDDMLHQMDNPLQA
jgi:siderophore synthetase component